MLPEKEREKAEACHVRGRARKPQRQRRAPGTTPVEVFKKKGLQVIVFGQLLQRERFSRFSGRPLCRPFRRIFPAGTHRILKTPYRPGHARAGRRGAKRSKRLSPQENAYFP